MFRLPRVVTVPKIQQRFIYLNLILLKKNTIQETTMDGCKDKDCTEKENPRNTSKKYYRRAEHR